MAETQASPDRLLTAAEVADRLRTTVGTLHYWRSVPAKAPKGFPLGGRLGSKAVWREADVTRYVDGLFDEST
jgi:hypothetical protein